MAQTSTHITACNVGLWIDNAAGTPVDCSGSSNEVALDFSQNIGELRTFGTDFPRRKACGRDATIALTAIYSTAADEALDVIKNWYFSSSHSDARTVSVYVPDKNVGSDHYYGEFVLEGFSTTLTAGEGSPVAATINLSVDGEAYWSTAAT